MPDQPPHLLLDQNIPAAIAGWLRSQRSSWKIDHVCEVGLAGPADTELFLWAQGQRS